MLNGFVFDIEANGFYFDADKVWCIHFIDIQNQDKYLKVYPFKDVNAKNKIIEWMESYNNPVIAGHNILGYDLFVMKKLLDYDFSTGIFMEDGNFSGDTFLGYDCQYIDTFFLSMFINADEQEHSLEYYGEKLGYPKMDLLKKLIDDDILPKGSKKGSQFRLYTEQMDEYCFNDVKVNIKLLEMLYNLYIGMYSPSGKVVLNSFIAGQKQFYLMECQAICGWKLDYAKAVELLPEIQRMMDVIADRIEPNLPERVMNKGEVKDYTMPSRVTNKTGGLSSDMSRFIMKHNGIAVNSNVYLFYGKEYEIGSKVVLDVKAKMSLKHQEALKEWLMELGWQPTFWNTKMEGRSKVNTSPKIQENGKICPNLLALEGSDIVKDVVKWLSLKNRLGILNGWLTNERLKVDGRLSTSRSGIANTHRQKHSCVVNVPKAEKGVVLGYEFRSLFTCNDDCVITAADAKALEARVKGHYTFKYDNGETARLVLSGDPHSKNAKYAFYIEETKHFDIDAPDFDKDDIVFKPYRSKSKSGDYALTYGCSPKKLAKTLGKDESEGDVIYERYWKLNWATKRLIDNLTAYWESHDKKYIPAIDGRYLISRKKHSLLNLLFQSCGAIAMDYACLILDRRLGGIKWVGGVPCYETRMGVVKRIGYFHDEIELEHEKGHEKIFQMLLTDSIKEAGDFLKLRVPLEGDSKSGMNWCEVH